MYEVCLIFPKEAGPIWDRKKERLFRFIWTGWCDKYIENRTEPKRPMNWVARRVQG